MTAPEETASPSAARERGLLDRVALALADGGEIVDVGAFPEAGAPAELAARLRDDVPQGALVVCAGVLEGLEEFQIVVAALVSAAAEHGATVIIAVANHTVGQHDEAHRSSWGEGAVAELRQLLPPDHVVWHQVALRGAALAPAGGSARLDVVVEVEDDGVTVPAGYVMAFGPRIAALTAMATVGTADLSAERGFERGRAAELAVLRARLALLESPPELALPDGGQSAESAG
jgi:hypothetical protein